MPSMIQEIRRKFPFRAKEEVGIAEGGQNPAPSAAVVEISVEDIIPNRSQPRSSFNQNAILRLADSIRRYGILQPLTVRKILVPAKPPIPATDTTGAGDTYLPPNFYDKHATHTVLYELIAGERRLRAAKIAELATVPCIIINTDDATSAELAIVENILREDLNMFEQAEAFRRLIDEFMLTQEEVARRVSLSQSAVANKLRILRLSRDERQRILEAGLTERHARALLKISDEYNREPVLTHIIENKLNVSNTEAYIDRVLDELCRQKRERLPQEHQSSEIVDSQEFLEPTAEDIHSNTSPILRKKGAIRDIRLFYNSVRNAAGILEQTGAKVQIDQQENEDNIIVTLIIRPSGAGKPL